MRSLSASVPENFFQNQYPESTLPPLWEVIYQEAMRGHHLLFKRSDVERYDSRTVVRAFWQDATMTDELERLALRLIGCSELQAMVRIIDAIDDAQRAELYAYYRRVLWMWQHYMKERLN